MQLVFKLDVDERGQRRLLHHSYHVARVSRSVRRVLFTLPSESRVSARCVLVERMRRSVQVAHYLGCELPAALARARDAWLAGDAATAVAICDGQIMRDVHWQAWRIRFELDGGREAAAGARLIALLRAFGPGTAGPPGLRDSLDLGAQPPGLLDLLSSLSPELTERVGPHLVPLVATFDYERPEARRVLDWLPVAHWPARYLAWRLQRAPAVERRLEVEIDRRLTLEALPETDRGRLVKALELVEARKGRPAAHDVVASTRPHAVWRAARGQLPKGVQIAPPRHNRGPVPRLTVLQQSELRDWLDSLARDIAGVRLEQRNRDGREPKLAARDAFGALAAQAFTHAKLPALMRQLDDLLLRLELNAWLHRRELAPIADQVEKRIAASPFEIVCRAFDASQRPRLWLLRFGSTSRDPHALLTEKDGSWLFVEGVLDDVLASIPEYWFESVLAQLKQ